MFEAPTTLTRRVALVAAAVAALGGLAVLAGFSPARPTADARSPDGPPPADAGLTAREVLGPAAVMPVADEPPAKLVVDPPLPRELAKGLVVVQYRTENLRVVPVFGETALDVSPRIGHLHVTVDDAPWVWGVWYGTPGGELILAGLSAGPHKVLIELETPVHKPIARGVVEFEVPATDPKAGSGRPVVRSPVQPAAKLVVDPPDPDALAMGLALISYRAENAQILPVYGPAAAAVTPRIGHVHITVDDAPWHWVDATGQPVVVNGLPPGPHAIRIELADADHRVLDGKVVTFDVPRR